MEENKNITSNEDDKDSLAKTAVEKIVPEVNPTPKQLTNAVDSKQRLSEPEIMEGHHHHQAHHNKSWKDYFFEFFMLFLAVITGFFVENAREHYIEHRRAKQFASSLIIDLQADTSKLAPLTSNMIFARSMLDTFRFLINESPIQSISSGKIYWYGFAGGFNYDFVFNDATIQQLKNSGSLRYFTDTAVIRRISQYDQVVRFIESRMETDKQLLIETRKVRAYLMDNKYVSIANEIFALHSGKPPDFIRLDSFYKSNPPLLTTDKSLINEYVELSRTRQQLWMNLINSQNEAYQTAKDLITVLKKEYGLE